MPRPDYARACASASRKAQPRLDRAKEHGPIYRLGHEVDRAQRLAEDPGMVVRHHRNDNHRRGLVLGQAPDPDQDFDPPRA
jgi:hypothetical protein